MHDPSSVNGGEGIGEISSNGHSLGRSNLTTGVGEGGATYKLHNQIRAGLVPTRVEHGHQIGMGHPRGGSRLPCNPFVKFAFGRGGVRPLQGYKPVEARVLSAPNSRHTSRGEYLEQFVAVIDQRGHPFNLPPTLDFH